MTVTPGTFLGGSNVIQAQLPVDPSVVVAECTTGYCQLPKPDRTNALQKCGAKCRLKKGHSELHNCCNHTSEGDLYNTLQEAPNTPPDDDESWGPWQGYNPADYEDRADGARAGGARGER